MSSGKTPFRWARLLLMGLVGLTVWFVTRFGVCMFEQIQWKPNDSKRLAVQHAAYSCRGIVLDLQAPSGVAEVWKQDLSWWPWGPHHRCVPFRILRGKVPGSVKLLVDYEFSPGGEWLLAIRSRDGYWDHRSPYFPDQPNLSETEWKRLVAAAGETVKVGQ